MVDQLDLTQGNDVVLHAQSYTSFIMIETQDIYPLIKLEVSSRRNSLKVLSNGNET